VERTSGETKRRQVNKVNNLSMHFKSPCYLSEKSTFSVFQIRKNKLPIRRFLIDRGVTKLTKFPIFFPFSIRDYEE
jgi:hypothetical protein